MRIPTAANPSLALCQGKRTLAIDDVSSLSSVGVVSTLSGRPVVPIVSTDDGHGSGTTAKTQRGDAENYRAWCVSRSVAPITGPGSLSRYEYRGVAQYDLVRVAREARARTNSLSGGWGISIQTGYGGLALERYERSSARASVGNYGDVAVCGRSRASGCGAMDRDSFRFRGRGARDARQRGRLGLYAATGAGSAVGSDELGTVDAGRDRDRATTAYGALSGVTRAAGCGE